MDALKPHNPPNSQNSHSAQNSSAHALSFLMNLSDSELYKKAQEYGLNARLWKRKFAGLLPEVFRRGLYKKRGFASIHEFAFKLAGMSERSVDSVLNLARRIESMPTLKKQLETGSQGWTKLEVVARVATPKTDKFWAEKATRLSFHALRSYVSATKDDGRQAFTDFNNETYVTGARHVENKMELMQDAAFLNEVQSDKDWPKLSFPVAPEVEQALRIFKESNKCMTFNEALKLLLNQKNAKKKEVKIEICPDCAIKEGQKSKSRYIPAKVRHFIYAKYGGLCAFPTCTDAATNLHHTKRYAIAENHNPNFIVPLCEAHERLMHAGLIENEDQATHKWKLRKQPDVNHPKYQIDQAVSKHRREPLSLPTAYLSG